MVAARDLEHTPRVGKFSLLHILHPHAVHTQRHMVLSLARHRTRMTFDAFAVIDDEAVSHSKSLSSGNLPKWHYLQVPSLS
jgi:hypothetical protein